MAVYRISSRRLPSTSACRRAATIISGGQTVYTTIYATSDDADRASEITSGRANTPER